MKTSLIYKISLFVSCIIMAFYFILQSLVVFEYLKYTDFIGILGYVCFLGFVPFFFLVVLEFIKKSKEVQQKNVYLDKLNIEWSKASSNLSEFDKFVNSSVIVSKADASGKITYVNKRFEDVSGWKMEDIVGKDHNILNSKEHSKSFWQDMYRTVVKEKNIWNDVVINKTKNGELYYVDSYIKAEFDENGNLLEFMSIRQDVTDIKKKEIQIRNQIDAINNSNLVVEFDDKGNITYANNKFLNSLEYSLEEVKGKHHRIFLESEYGKTEEYQNFWKSLIDGKYYTGEIKRIKKDGSSIYLQATYNPIFNEEGKVYKIMKISTDITDVFNQRKEIEKLNLNLNSLVSSQTSYVLRTDMLGRHTYWNQKFEDEFGWVYEGDMMHGNSLLSICESHHGTAYSAVMECISEPGRVVKVELDKPHKDGGKRSTLWEFVCLFDTEGNPFEVQCMGIDITDRVNAEKKIIEILKEIEKKNIYLEHAAKILRHDMHSGINTYMPRGLSSLERRLSEEQIKELKIEAPIKMIKEGLKHTQKVYKGVYEFTNLVKKDAELNKESCDLKQILVDYLESTSYIKQIKIDKLTTIEVNQALFCTAIDNLIRNGLKYNDSESKIIDIFMEDEEHISIQDNGRGMTQEEFEYLSKPYNRREGQKETGTGLGLNICVAILDEHGFIVVCEKNEIGTKIKIKIKK